MGLRHNISLICKNQVPLIQIHLILENTSVETNQAFPGILPLNDIVT